MNKKAFREICATAARVWPMTAEPGRDPVRFEHYEFVGKYWVRVIVERNGEEAPPQRRAGDREQKESDYLAGDEPSWSDARKRLEDLTSDRSVDA